eukprot:scaffold2_cov132-Skeletonema_menzelii.AAC.9
MHTPEGASQKRILSSWPAVARITLMVIGTIGRCDVRREVFAKWGDRGLPSLKGVTPSKSSLNLSSQLNQ